MASTRKVCALALAVVLIGALSRSALSQQAGASETDDPIRGRAYTVIGFNGLIEWGACLKFLPGREFRLDGECRGVGTWSETNYILYSVWRADLPGQEHWTYSGYRIAGILISGQGAGGWCSGGFAGISIVTSLC
jgi:hypothetical protein